MKKMVENSSAVKVNWKKRMHVKLFLFLKKIRKKDAENCILNYEYSPMDCGDRQNWTTQV